MNLIHLQCAESVLVPTAAKEEDVYFVGNAPCGHFFENHPDPKSKSPVTFKVMFIKLCRVCLWWWSMFVYELHSACIASDVLYTIPRVPFINSSPFVNQRFFFRSQLLGKVRYKAWNYKDYAWVTKEELLEYFELDLSVYMKQMLVDDLRVIY